MKKATELNRMRGFVLNDYKPHQEGLVAIHRQRTVVEKNVFRTDCSCGGIMVGTYQDQENTVKLPHRFCPDHGVPMTVQFTEHNFDPNNGKYRGIQAAFRCPFTDGPWFNKHRCKQMISLLVDHAGRVRNATTHLAS